VNEDSRQRWQRARTVFDAVIELPPPQREARLLEDCGDDVELLAEVRSLLAAAEDDDNGTVPYSLSLERAAPDLLDDLGEAARKSESGAWVGARLGAWQLQRQIGRGGMGAVYLAERADGAYRQQAAVKLIRADWDAAELLRRFHDERQILAQLNHPNIARLLDGGLTEDGKPFLVLEYIAGHTIIEHCDAQRLDIARRLALFLTVCSAVEHAHRNLIVHRDLKPSNILVGEDGQVKLLDFGIAKMLEAGAARTLTAARTFTPEYAAPEQLRGEPVTTSVDVHALGLLLFELLSGERPYAGSASTPAAQERAILDQEPPPPSRSNRTDCQQATDRAKARSTDPATLRARLRGDLDAIVLMALRKDPSQRYASVSALADDIRRYLAKLPVQARQGHLRYRATRFLQRHALATALSALAMLAVVGGLLLALWQAEQTRQQRDLARIEAEKAGAVANFLGELFEGADPERTDGVTPTARDLLDKAVERIDQQTGLATGVRASLLTTMGRAYQSLGEHAVAEPLLIGALEASERAGDLRLQARILSRLAEHHAYIGQFERSQEFGTRQLDLLDQHRIDDPDLRRTAHTYIGNALVYMGRFEEGVAQLAPVHAELVELGDPVSVEMAGLLPPLASALARLNRVDEALALTRPSYEAAIANPDLPLVYSTLFLNAHSIALGQARHYEEAAVATRQYLEQMIRLYGEDDFRTSTAYNNLAGTLSDLQRHDEAIVAIEKTLAIRRRVLAPDHDRLAMALLFAAVTHAEARDYDTALARVDEALQILVDKGAAESFGGIQARYRKARIHEQRGEYALAMASIEMVLPFVGGEPNYYRGQQAAIPLNLYARLLHRDGRLAADCAPLDRVLALDPIRLEHAVEARILAAACALQHGDHARAAALLDLIPEPLPEREVTDYARALLQQLKQATSGPSRG